MMASLVAFLKECARRPQDSGQAMIFFAVLLSGMMLTLGVAVEGGRVFVEYRHMQSAADMAALVGAQDLPQNTSSAVADACTYLQSNGYDDCSSVPVSNADGASQSIVCVPPESKSPYSFTGTNYTYGGTANAGCGSSSGAQYYLETRINENLGTIPIFNIPVTLAAHAVAKHGTPSPRDFALAILNPSMKGALSFSGNQRPSFVMVGPATVNSTDASAVTTGGTGDPIACTGQWFVSGPESVPPFGPAGNLTSKNTLDTVSGAITPAFAPPDCFGSGIGGGAGGNDSNTAFFPNAQQIPDPYCESANPPTLSTIPQSTNADGLDPLCPGSTTANAVTSMSNCLACNQNAYYYSWTTSRSGGTWGQVPSSGALSVKGNTELFPGIYPGGIKVTAGATVYMDPGVYTLGGDFDATSQATICIYGSPECDRTTSAVPGAGSATCSNDSFGSDPTTSAYATNAANWYYYCSPFGSWDSNLCLGYTGSGSCTSGGTCTVNNVDTTLCPRPSILSTVPTFINGATPNVPLNGVTFYLTGGGSFRMEGGAAGFLTDPDPCPGTGTGSASSAQFPQGAPSLSYQYQSGDIAYQDLTAEGIATTSGADWIYPNMDLQTGGECSTFSPSTSAGDVWQNEFGGSLPSQHLHFFVFDRGANSLIHLGGGSAQNAFGILYDWNPLACGGTNCTVTLDGGSGGSSGPPLLTGQVIADNAAITGNSTAEVFFRPCPSEQSCSTGPGSALVQ